MGERTVNIGLSLGADICWPICYENLLRDLNLDLDLNGDRVRVACERVSIEPFNLRQPVKYDVVIDRLTHWYSTSREWIKKAILLDDLNKALRCQRDRDHEPAGCRPAARLVHSLCRPRSADEEGELRPISAAA